MRPLVGWCFFLVVLFIRFFFREENLFSRVARYFNGKYLSIYWWVLQIFENKRAIPPGSRRTETLMSDHNNSIAWTLDSFASKRKESTVHSGTRPSTRQLVGWRVTALPKGSGGTTRKWPHPAKTTRLLPQPHQSWFNCPKLRKRYNIPGCIVEHWTD